MQPTSPPSDLPRSDTLALLYQNILTGIVRVQTGRQPLSDVETFRRRMRAMLQDVEREASAASYSAADIRDAEFAVVAFLDEAILSSKDPKAEEWRRKPLNIEMFGQAVAGDVFFDKLLEIERRRDSGPLADLLEVYLICLLLGFEGRFAPPLRGEAHRIMERIRGRIEAIRGGRDYKLSPPMKFQAEVAVAAPGASQSWKWWVLGSLAAVVLLFFVYKLTLSMRTDRLEGMLLRPHASSTGVPAA